MPPEPNVTKQLVVPRSMIPTLLTIYHDSMIAGHQGTKRTYVAIAKHYWWPLMRTDISAYIATCEECQKRKRAYTAQLPVLTFPVTKPMQRISMDITGPLPTTTHGYQYILVVTEYLTRYTELYPLRNMRATTVADCMVDYIMRYGTPQNLLTDKGANFVGAVMTHLNKILGINKIQTSAYHPQTDGVTERTNQTLKVIMCHFINRQGDNWVELLPIIRYVLNTHVNNTTNTTPFFAMYGRHPVMALDHIYQQSHLRQAGGTAGEYAQRLYERINKIHEYVANKLSEVKHPVLNAKSKLIKYKAGDQVWLKRYTFEADEVRKLATKWDGPYEVSTTPGLNTVTININGQAQIVHQSRVKPAYVRVWQNDTNNKIIDRIIKYDDKLASKRAKLNNSQHENETQVGEPTNNQDNTEAKHIYDHEWFETKYDSKHDDINNTGTKINKPNTIPQPTPINSLSFPTLPPKTRAQHSVNTQDGSNQ
jgi:hypothetical protein